MSQIERIKNKNGIYHIILQGANYMHEKVFGWDEDKEKFIQILGLYKKKYGYEIYAYCIMDNHAHILLKEGKETISETVKAIRSAYIYWYSSRHRRCGQVFEERFKSEAIENHDDFTSTLRSIHQNPLKEGLVESLEEYKWSSYHEYVKGCKIVDIDIGLELFSGNKDNFIMFHDEITNDTRI